MQQAKDFLDECEALFLLVLNMRPEHLDEPTGFKNWTTNTIIRHLHFWNRAAHASLSNPDKFHILVDPALPHVSSGTLPKIEEELLAGLSGKALTSAWKSGYDALAADFEKTDPATRVVWAGPDMSARSSATARQMETWAHGQAIYDLLGIARKNEDRIRNIVVLGVNTFGWTHQVNGLEIPVLKPWLELTSPSGEIWNFGDAENENLITGPAEEFCQVVTQTRNIADTTLQVSGINAQRWMEIAQCFAGPAEKPPAPGARSGA